jgi:SAM-dependent methyltransferase
MNTPKTEENLIQRRESYIPYWPTEEFIVTILKNRIENLIEKHFFKSNQEVYTLDVGCGEQPFRKKIELLGHTYKSFDITQNLSQNVDFIGAIDQDLPEELFENPPFDFIICTEVLEHVANWEKTFVNLSTLLAPEGIVIITCPHFLGLHEEPHDYWRPTLYAIEYFANKNNLIAIHSERAGDTWDVLGTLLASCWTFPASSNLLDRIVTKFVSLARESMFNLIKSRAIQKRTKLMGALYLSNVSVLQKNNQSLIC